MPHLVVPDALPGSPFEAIPVRHTKRWREVALWWPARANARRRRGDRHQPVLRRRRRHDAGVHLLLRLSPPRDALGAFEPEHLLVGHGEGLHGVAATTAFAMRSTTHAAGFRGSRFACRRSRSTRSAGAVASRWTRSSEDRRRRLGRAARQPASAAGRSSFAGRRRPASRTGGLSGSASGGAPNERRTCSSGGVP